MQNEILKPVLETDETAIPRYDIVNPDGSVAQQNVELRLKNEVMQQGTPYDEESVLPATLRESLELPKEATPAEAMAKMLSMSGGAVIRNRPPKVTDAEKVGKLWVIPNMTFHNLMPNALAMSSSDWAISNASSSTSNDAITVTGNGSNSTFSAIASLLGSVNSGERVYIHANVTAVDDANSIAVEMLIGDTTVYQKVIQYPSSGTLTVVSDAITAETSGQLKLKVTSAYNTSTVQSSKSVKISSVTVINLTKDMCEAQSDNEFTSDEALEYLKTFGNFQTKEYEYGATYWTLRGVTNGAYQWYRNYDVTPENIQSAGKTVLDTSINKLVTIESEIDYFDSYSWPYRPTDYMHMYEDSNNAGNFDCFVYNGNKIAMAMYYQSGNSYYVTTYLKDLLTGNNIANWSFTASSNNYAKAAKFYASNYASLNGDIIAGYGGSGLIAFYDLSREVYATFSEGGVSQLFKSASKWGYIYVGGYNSRTLHVANQGSGSFSSVSFGNGVSSSYYDLQMIGVYDDTLWYAEKVSNNSYSLCKVDLISAKITKSVSTFTASRNINLWRSIQDGKYAYVYVYASTSNPYTRALKIDMSDGSNNWNDVNNSEVVTLSHSAYVTYNYYFGSTATHHYFVFNGGMASINAETGAIAFYADSNIGIAVQTSTGGSVVRNTVNGLEHIIFHGPYFLDTKNNSFYTIVAKPRFTTASYVSGNIKAYTRVNHAFGFGGSIKTIDAIGCIGYDNTSFIFLGKNIHKKLSSVTEYKEEE